MELSQLKYFYETAKQNSFSKAARKLNAQQPTLSRAVRMLEDEFGAKLFLRNTRSVNLTPSGQRLFTECKKLFELVETIPGAVRSSAQELSGYLQFGLSDSMIQSVLPNLMKDFAARHPKVILSIASGPAPHLLQKIEQGELEFGIFFADPKSWRSLNSDLIMSVDFYVVVATKHCKNQEVLNSYIAAREIEDAREHDAQELQVLQAILPNYRIRFSANSYLVHKELVLNGLGVSTFPVFAIEKELKLKKLKILNSAHPIKLNLNLISLKGRFLSERAQAFISQLKMSR